MTSQPQSPQQAYTKFCDHAISTLMYDNKALVVTAVSLNRVYGLRKPTKHTKGVDSSQATTFSDTRTYIDIPHPFNPCLNKSLIEYWHEVIEKQPWKERYLPQYQGGDTPTCDEDLLDVLIGAAPWPDHWDPSWRSYNKLEALPWFLNRTSGLPLDAAAFHQPWMTSLRNNQSITEFVAQVMRRRIYIMQGIARTTENGGLLKYAIPPLPDTMGAIHCITSAIERSFFVIDKLAAFRPGGSAGRGRGNRGRGGGRGGGRGHRGHRGGGRGKHPSWGGEIHPSYQHQNHDHATDDDPHKEDYHHQSFSQTQTYDMMYDRLRTLHGVFCLTPCVFKSNFEGEDDIVVNCPGTLVFLNDSHPAPYERYSIECCKGYSVACGLFMTWILDQTPSSSGSNTNSRESARNRAVRKKTNMQYKSERNMIHQCEQFKLVPPLSSASKFLSTYYSWVPVQMTRRPLWWWDNMYPKLQFPNDRIEVVNVDVDVFDTTGTGCGTLSDKQRQTAHRIYLSGREVRVTGDDSGEEAVQPHDDDDVISSTETLLCHIYNNRARYAAETTSSDDQPPFEVTPPYDGDGGGDYTTKVSDNNADDVESTGLISSMLSKLILEELKPCPHVAQIFQFKPYHQGINTFVE